ncbi:MAG: hypothetical protein A2X86_14545 [Bdellovibrionales bacterium GWA2_49_15]|nr:MAG: hypothetical protein A2X86_14545 [Bdellovibrionales bacterium GWA2_49_15]HAZ13441.1 hypothetical protein [Bdellovibrionales bacterium]
MSVNILNISNSEEVKPFLLGISSNLLQEASKRVEFNSFIVARSTVLTALVHNLSQAFPERKSATAVSAFYAFLVAKNLDWVNTQTIDQIILAALLQDIGLPKAREKLPPASFEQFVLQHPEAFRSHPKEGLLLLQNIEHIPERVRQIIYQHHEYCNGLGFPNGISAMRIYPPAKILSLVSGFVDDVLQNPNERPANTLKKFVSDREKVSRYDADCVRALIKLFIPEKSR